MSGDSIENPVPPGHLRWDQVPARVWVPNALAGAAGAIVVLALAVVVLSKLGMSRAVTGMIGQLETFIEGL